jgi:hypothetical protein
VTPESGKGAGGGRSEMNSHKRLAGDAERIAEEWAGKIGRWVVGTAARAREEAEDIWADAQALRRGP